MRRWKGLAGGCLALLAVATACTGEDDGGGEDPLAEVAELLNESRRLEAEAISLEYRVIERCLEDRGHTVHEPRELRSWEPADLASVEGEHPHEDSLPDVETAEAWGFGQWVNSEHADPDAWEEYEEATLPDQPEDEWEEADASEFEALSPEDQFSWYVDYLGRAHAQWQYGEHFGFEAPPENGEDGDGSLEFDHNISEEPPPGGCRLEMIESLYGEAQTVESEGGSADAAEAYVEWVYRPAVPLGEGNPQADVASAIEHTRAMLVADFRGEVAAEEEDFLSCVADRGHGNWSFQEHGGLDVATYWGNAYHGEMNGDSEGGFPDLPADLPEDFDSLKDLEIAMAVDFAECAGDSGLRDASERAWTRVNGDYYATVETEMYAWQEEMRDVIAKAQELLEA
jgi:hypothetical protein